MKKMNTATLTAEETAARDIRVARSRAWHAAHPKGASAKHIAKTANPRKVSKAEQDLRTMATGAFKSRSVQRRVAIQTGQPLPRFDETPSASETPKPRTVEEFVSRKVDEALAQAVEPVVVAVTPNITEPFYTRHHGPYQLQISRTDLASDTGFKVSILPGEVAGSDAESEAMALLSDPRDTITSVSVWSIPESQHVTTFTNKTTAS